MELEWTKDPGFTDSWDLCSDTKILAYTVRGKSNGVLMWSSEHHQWKKAPSQDVEEAKVIIQAMVLLEG
jgi:hypothetical protein